MILWLLNKDSGVFLVSKKKHFSQHGKPQVWNAFKSLRSGDESLSVGSMSNFPIAHTFLTYETAKHCEFKGPFIPTIFAWQPTLIYDSIQFINNFIKEIT